MIAEKKKVNALMFRAEGVFKNKVAVCPRCGCEHMVAVGRFGKGRLWEYVVCKNGRSYLVNINT